MKIVFWNLKNLGTTKLGAEFTAAMRATGLGNTVGEYVVNVVMGQPSWSHVNTAGPADVFVVVELKSGGSTKGAAASGAAVPVLASLVAWMNAVANAGREADDPNPDVQYSYVPPRVIGHHECVGVVYNERRLRLRGSGILRDDVGDANFLPRAPFWTRFRSRATDEPVNVVGIHAPPPAGAADVKYRPGIRYANSLTRSSELDVADQMEAEDTLVGGDYNCDPTYTYASPAGEVGFAMAGYATSLAPVTYSSVRASLVNANPQPTNYLNDAYDNVMHAFPDGVPAGLVQRVLDLIGHARDMRHDPPAPLYPASRQMVFNAYRTVSDHLPVLFQY